MFNQLQHFLVIFDRIPIERVVLKAFPQRLYPCQYRMDFFESRQRNFRSPALVHQYRMDFFESRQRNFRSPALVQQVVAPFTDKLQRSPIRIGLGIDVAFVVTVIGQD